jgi:hypothetical protein
MIGDSWTDIAAGTSIIDSLRDYLVNDYGFKIAGATLAGRKMETVQSTSLHFRVIDEAGPEIRYMLLSLGGNDWDYEAGAYHSDPLAEQKRVNDRIASILSDIIETGNTYKISTWGGEPLLWIIHGYDYLNPDNEYSADLVDLSAGCRSFYLKQGFTDSDIDSFFKTGKIDSYNTMLSGLALSNPDLYYIDLRGTLGGPPVADPSLMLDCMHPNPVGFNLITHSYVVSLDSITGGVR